MKYYLVFILIVCVSCSDNKKAKIHGLLSSEEYESEVVYICTGPSSKKFHSSERCQWLSNCSTEIEAITVEEALNLRRDPCKACYGEESYEQFYDPDRFDLKNDLK